ncbi:hypothetical protein RM780_03865 [Streptomyces sp. DSM 44917]|uniref:Uncharacterized protein n=1 Tax=Streptomyces boetiae TaxID=3075541 RepID=A0ABU2L3G1_9ACTN|nr:hypothetical protein [Streptomyces sp. DSM 44917]MDT0306099.1 hypothetical protein [Streptomyces sp. DSM 44917]
MWTKRRLLESLPKEAATRGIVAPPEVPEAQYWIPALIGATGVVLCLQGGASILLGLVAIMVGIGLAIRVRYRVEEAREALAAWERSRYCVACDRTLSGYTETA